MIGVDEVGRGCWAGPLLVVAVRAKADLPLGLKDSKLMTKLQRQQILNTLSSCCEFGEGWVNVAEIDSRGLAIALRLGIARALRMLKAQIDEEIIMDGKVNYVPAHFSNVKCLVDADVLIPLVSAAGIFAKVRRDSYMGKLKKRYPAYGFENHVGYGTAAHKLAIEQHGILEGVHRMSFKPLQILAEAQN
ncbi:MAG: ribonuclease HII [Candidatus Saccharimonadales bacterium]|jgi:ribonuclease HII